MNPVRQDKFGAPDGNCFTACVASILELDLHDLRWMEEVHARGAAACEEGRVDEWAAAWDEMSRLLCERQGVALASVSARSLVDGYYPTTGGYYPVPYLGQYEQTGHYVASGPAARGLQHCVVARRGEFVHDPHPDGTYIERVDNVTVLLPVGRK